MKKASDYIPGEILERIGDYSTYILEAIRLAQEDAIKETVKECSENARLSYGERLEVPEYCEEPFTSHCDELENWLYIDRNYILSVADKLIQQL